MGFELKFTVHGWTGVRGQPFDRLRVQGTSNVRRQRTDVSGQSVKLKAQGEPPPSPPPEGDKETGRAGGSRLERQRSEIGRGQSAPLRHAQGPLLIGSGNGERLENRNAEIGDQPSRCWCAASLIKCELEY
jgi:hypothetical protein